jgi:hypothetical protein
MLNRIVRLYIPSTVNDVVDCKKQKEWVAKALKTFARLFGGATAMQAEGAWVMEDDTLVVEPIVLVYSFTDDAGLAEQRQVVERFAQQIAVDMAQECVSVEFDGELHFIQPQKEAA